MNKIQKLIKKNEIEILKDFQDFIKFPSVYDESTVSDQAPFGSAVKEAYNWILSKASEDGFGVMNFENKMGSILIGPKKEKYTAAIAHLDVVPATGKWKHGIFDGSIVDNQIWGRGTQDDKGPLIATYWAMKIVKEILGNKIKNDFRLMVGTNEERGMSDLIDFVKSDHTKPYFSFTPDAAFPAAFSEKHVVDVKVYVKKPVWLSKFKAGSASNMVAEEAELWTTEGQSFKAHGKAAHGSTPKAGVNAATLLFHEALSKYTDKFSVFMRNLHTDYHGETLGVNYNDEKLGDTSCNLGVVDTDENHVILTINIRIPGSVNFDKFEEKIKNIANIIPGAVKAEKSKGGKGYLLDQNTPEYQNLINSYRKVTGDEKTQPIALGGGTYARYIHNCVPFGFLFPYSKEFFHQKDERMNLDEFFKGLEIMVETIMGMVK